MIYRHGARKEKEYAWCSDDIETKRNTKILWPI